MYFSILFMFKFQKYQHKVIQLYTTREIPATFVINYWRGIHGVLCQFAMEMACISEDQENVN